MLNIPVHTVTDADPILVAVAEALEMAARKRGAGNPWAWTDDAALAVEAYRRAVRHLASLGEYPALQLDGAGLGGTLSILLSNGADSVAVADRLLAAVTKWRDEIRARAEAAGRCVHGECWNDSAPCPAGEVGHDFSIGGRPGGSLHR